MRSRGSFDWEVTLGSFFKVSKLGPLKRLSKRLPNRESFHWIPFHRPKFGDLKTHPRVMLFEEYDVGIELQRSQLLERDAQGNAWKRDERRSRLACMARD